MMTALAMTMSADDKKPTRDNDRQQSGNTDKAGNHGKEDKDGGGHAGAEGASKKRGDRDGARRDSKPAPKQ